MHGCAMLKIIINNWIQQRRCTAIPKAHEIRLHHDNYKSTCTLTATNFKLLVTKKAHFHVPQ